MARSCVVFHRPDLLLSYLLCAYITTGSFVDAVLRDGKAGGGPCDRDRLDWDRLLPCVLVRARGCSDRDRLLACDLLDLPDLPDRLLAWVLVLDGARRDEPRLRELLPLLVRGSGFD
jgi:hypothetical protein